MKSSIFEDARFLIVDDEPQNINVLTQMLEQWDAVNIASTTDPRQTFSLFESFKPDIILLDVMMPGMDGFEVMEQLKPALSPEEFLPILILTADSSDRVKHRALSAGAADFLNKPFNAIELSLRLQNLLSQRSLHRRLQDQNHLLDERVQERTQQLAQAEIDTAECLALAMDYRDDATGWHTQRVGHLAARLGAALGNSAEEIELLRRAAPLHDVGKIGISDHILLKPGKLTPEEFDMMKTHTTIGAKILGRHPTVLLRLASEIALTHHERWDGRGYPQGIGGDDIPLCGRIVAVADVFDVMTHERPYKTAGSIEEATTEIQRQSGSQFDPAVVTAFLNLSAQPV